MKIIRFITVISLLIALFPIQAFASSAVVENEDTLHFSNGSYITIQIKESYARAAASKNAEKIYTYCDIWGNEKWRITLTGSFTYDGNTSKCTLSGVIIGITDTNWYIISRDDYAQGDTAYGTVVMGYKLLGITTDKETLNMSMTCDKNGNIT